MQFIAQKGWVNNYKLSVHRKTMDFYSGAIGKFLFGCVSFRVPLRGPVAQYG
jgi:hypothetical protein